MIQKIENYCRQQHMIQKGDKILIGLSGGADSVCLFFVLLELKEKYGLSLYAVHIHHGIRGEEADHDERFVRELCASFHVPCKVRHYKVLEIAKERGLSEEEAGRMVRYETFQELCKEKNFTKIAVAHHIKDQAETVLFHLCRGSGLSGLSGMYPISSNIIRPLLCVKKEQMEAYLIKKGQTWCIDSTNSQNCYMRNRLRNEVLPYLEKQVNVNTVEHIAYAGTILGETYLYIRKEAKKKRETLKEQVFYTETEKGIEISVKEMQEVEKVLRREIFRMILEEMGGLRDVMAEHIEGMDNILNGSTGRSFSLPNHRRIMRSYEKLFIFQKIKNQEKQSNLKITERPLQLGSEVEISAFQGKSQILTVGIPLELNQFCQTEGIERKKIIEQNPYTKCFDYDKIKSTLTLRTRKEGDYLDLGIGKTKLKKYFIDQKIPKEERDKILLIADGSHILWVLGYRISAGYKVTEDTKTILQIKISGGQENGGKNSRIIE